MYNHSFKVVRYPNGYRAHVVDAAAGRLLAVSLPARNNRNTAAQDGMRLSHAVG